ncbi:MAG TPA: (deoxy)nucleoside triphosphate pyrophosphohydrolase [Candidatus Eisenbacteria bacterium]|jgi:8-oxo-dGTP diphosphatase
MDDSTHDPIHLHHPAGPGVGRRIQVVAAVVTREGRLLLTRRPPGGPLGLQWEFPGGKVEDGESPEHAMVREIHEELGVNARPKGVIEVESHDYPHGLEVEILFVRCDLDSYDFQPGPGVHELRWWVPSEIDLEQVLAADREFLRSWGHGETRSKGPAPSSTR